MVSSPHLGQNLHQSGCHGCTQGMLCQLDGAPTSGARVQAQVWRGGGKDPAPPASLNPWGHMLPCDGSSVPVSPGGPGSGGGWHWRCL